jgi:hypothetical protein
MIRFWEDIWLDQPLQMKFPTLYQMSLQRKRTVQEIYSMGTWQLSFAGTLSRQDQQHLQNLRRNLEGITPNDQDTYMALWIREGSQFTVKSHYKFMQQGLHIKSELHKLLKIGALPRVIVFSWLLLRNAILIIDNLRKRGW